jgi:hypothetical protein
VTRSKVASPNSGSHRSCWVEASHASPDLSSNSRMVGSCRPMPYKPRIRLSFAIVYYPGDGTPGQSASHVRENLIKAWPSDSIDPTRPATPHPERHGAGHTTLQPSPAPPPPPVGCHRRKLRSCGAKPSVEVVGALLRSCGSTAWVGGGPIDDVRPLPLRRESWAYPTGRRCWAAAGVDRH